MPGPQRRHEVAAGGGEQAVGGCGAEIGEPALQHGELATQLGKSVDAVKKMASRAMRRLRVTPLPSHVGIGHRG